MRINGLGPHARRLCRLLDGASLLMLSSHSTSSPFRGMQTDIGFLYEAFLRASSYKNIRMFRINSIPFLTIAGGTIGLSVTRSGIILRD